LNKEQVLANRQQVIDLKMKEKNLPIPEWIVENSLNIPKLNLEKCDFIFSCPPYYNLET